MSYKLQTSCLKFSYSLLFLLVFQLGKAQNKKNDKEYGIQRFEAFDNQLRQNQKVLGGDVVALIAFDTIVYKRELGEFNSKTEAPLAAASQWLTAALIMTLVDEGKLSLEDKVSDYLPIFSKYGKNYISIRHCLSHFTGVQWSGRTVWEMPRAASLEEAAEAMAKREIQTNPGTEFRLSPVGPILAGRIAEIVTKKKFDQLIKQKLLNPMGMTKTSFATLDGSAVNPAGGARSIANDYLKFLQMLLNKGKFNGKQILSEASVAEIRKVHSSSETMRPASKVVSGFNYALGSWVLRSEDGTATAMVSPAFHGVFPMVDWCRGYAAIVFTKNVLDEPKLPLYLPLKEAIDVQRSGNCD